MTRLMASSTDSSSGRAPAFGERLAHACRRLAALAGVGLVDDDREGVSAVGVADLLVDERELLHRGDDDLLAGLDGRPQLGGGPHVGDRRTDLGELPDGGVELAVEVHPVGHHEDRVEDPLAVVFEADQLVGQPGDRVRLAAARRVLDEVAPPGTVRRAVGQQPPDHVELVVAGEDRLGLLLAGPQVLLGDDLGVVLDDVGQAGRGEDLLPEVVGLQSAGVGRVSGAVVVAPVEGQEPGVLALQLGAEADHLVVDSEVHHAAAGLEDQLAGVAVPLVLLDGVLGRLLGDLVLQLERGYWQPVDEQCRVKGELCLVRL